MATTLSSWKQIGDIYWSKAERQTQVTPEIKALAIKIVGNKKGLLAARALYDWVTQNIHYVSITLNQAQDYIPHSATEVLQNGYGDCKDKVTLLQALLKSVDIPSQTVLINWDNNFHPFPLPTPLLFNHAIIYFPQFHTFANPTDQYASFGTLDTGLSGKRVVIAGNPSQVAYTPKGSEDDNRYQFVSQTNIEPDGTLTGHAHLAFFGYLNNIIREALNEASSPNQIVDETLAMTPEGGTGTLTSSNPNDLNQAVTVYSRWNSPYGVNMGPTLYFTVPIGADVFFPSKLRRYISVSHRLYPLVVGAQGLEWHYEMTLPAGYHLTHLPVDLHFSNTAGDYSSHYENKEGKIYVERHLKIKQDVYSPSEYPEFLQLAYQAINDARSILVAQK